MFQPKQPRISEKIESTLDSDALPFHEILDADMVESALIDAKARRDGSSARVRQAQLIGAALRPPRTTAMHTTPIMLSNHVARSGTDVVLRIRLSEVTSNPKGR
jgi:hypothetical protein